MRRIKKIKNYRQLYSEQKRLRKEEAENSEKIRRSWKDIKEHVQNGRIAEDLFSLWRNRKMKKVLTGDSVIGNSLSYGAALFTGRLVKKAEDKINNLFK